jgi:oligopeptidase B
MLPEIIENTTGQVVWAADSKTLFYVKKNMATLRSERVYRHKAGNSVTSDKEVYFE